ncbi:MAG: hypothetical protein H0W44_05115 [Gammaproteobacteria bacterium]|nr:hypothetical protein [Gammaproteobacteria bacterium]
MRQITAALLIGLIVLGASAAHALGLGDIEVFSALNQPLDAEIALTSTKPGETDGMIVKLASEQVFQQAGLERPFYLTKLSFQIAAKPNGSQYIKVSSKDLIREPFLSFLVDVEWPRGRLVREYTLLLDPPVFTTPSETTAQPAVQPAIVPAPVMPALSEPAPIQREIVPLPATTEPPAGDAFDFGENGAATGDQVAVIPGLPEIEIENNNDAVAPIAEASVSVPVSDETAVMEAAAETPVFTDAAEFPDIELEFDESIPYDKVATAAVLAQIKAEELAKSTKPTVKPPAQSGDHKVVAGDTLWEIAEKYKPANVSVHQAMLAILQTNPDAFIRNNVNSVRKGYVLRMPDGQAMSAISYADAAAQIKEQNALWREYSGQIAGAATMGVESGSRPTVAKADARLDLLAPSNSKSSKSASGNQAGSDAGDVKQNDLKLAREALAAERVEKNELRSRLTDLEKQIKTMQRIISLRDEQLAQLQAQLEAKNKAAATTKPSVPTADKPSKIKSSAGASEGAPLGESQRNNLSAPVTDVSPASKSVSPSVSKPIDPSNTVITKDTSPAAPANTNALDKTDIENNTDAANDIANSDVVDSDVAEKPIAIEPAPTPVTRKPTGPLALIYNSLPAPYNMMLADALESPLGLGVLAAVLLILLGIIFAIFKMVTGSTQDNKPKIKSNSMQSRAAPTASFGEKLSEMFAPLLAVFQGNKNKNKKIIINMPPEDDDEDFPVERSIEDQIFGDDELGGTQDGDDVADEIFGKPTPKLTSKTDYQESPTIIEALPIIDEPEEDEVMDDTTAEADVYLAYKLFDQAEELLKQAIADNPARNDYKYKLVESYYAMVKDAQDENDTATANKHQATFLTAADSLKKATKAKGRLWAKAVAMGKQLAPDHALFAGESAAGVNLAELAPAKPQTPDLDFSDSDTDTEAAPDFNLDDGSSDLEFDLDLDANSTDVVVSLEDDLEFDGDLLGNNALESDDDALDFDMPTMVEETLAIDDSDMDLDFDAAELGLDDDSADETGTATLVEDPFSIEMGNETLIDDADFGGETLIEGGGDDAGNETLIDAADAGEAEDDDEFDLGLEDLMDEIDPTSNRRSEETIALDFTEDFEVATTGGNSKLLADDENELLFEDFQTPAKPVKAAPAVSFDDDDDTDDTMFNFADEDGGEDTHIDNEDDDSLIGDSDADEVDTKLDLAKAYLDMGDYDGANSTLEEVLSEGNEEQRREASSLLEQIA